MTSELAATTDNTAQTAKAQIVLQLCLC